MAADSAAIDTRFGHPVLKLETRRGASAQVSLYGAHVLAWQPVGGREKLYLSPLADTADGRAIRGGIPVCFPQFSERGAGPRHGFVRNRLWQLEDHVSGGDFARAVLVLQSDESTRSLWPHDFSLELTVGIEDERLDVELEVRNTGATPFAFGGALHTYLRVDEVEECQLGGLYGHDFEDLCHDSRVTRESGEVLIIGAETDRIYRGVANPLLLRDGNRALGIGHEAFPDTVVWNPWEEKAAAIDDLPPRDFRRFLCVEAAIAHETVEVKPGEDWWGRQTLVQIR